MRWVYTSGTEKPPPRAPVIKKEEKPQGFFKSLFSFAAATASTPQIAPQQPPPPPPVKKDPRKVEETSVNLSIFTMDMDVTLDRKMTAELYRSMQKNPPKAVKYSLIYVSCIYRLTYARTKVIVDRERRIRRQQEGGRAGCLGIGEHLPRAESGSRRAGYHQALHCMSLLCRSNEWKDDFSSLLCF